MIGPQELAFLGQGLMWTLALTAIGFTGGILFGFLVALARVSPIRWISALAAGWTPVSPRGCGRRISYDCDTSGGEFFQLYGAATPEGLFLEICQRTGGYDGYGAPNAPFRIAAQKRMLRHSAVPRF